MKTRIGWRGGREEKEIKEVVFGLNKDYASGPGWFFSGILSRHMRGVGPNGESRKSFIYIHDKTPISGGRGQKGLPNQGGLFPFTYLGCPIFMGERRRSTLRVEKVSKANIIRKGMIRSHPRNHCQIFSGDLGDTKGKHWVAWDTIPREGGIGLRSLQHVVDALFAKLWWNFRTSTGSMWANFIWNKYCKKVHPVIAKGFGASHIWRKMIKVREEVEHNIGGKQRAESRFTLKLAILIDMEIVRYICEEMRPSAGGMDKAWWTANSNGKFSVSAWDILRTRKKQWRWRNNR
ncbi:hypothetical protein H5410_035359 [Solanum commersonii]|uniref:Uncharacterized protein n=1 Tax=Solanum commersonii TaxID=4109 RepID=A0A9J5Y2P4_SOLCO|nr:hypothetical protein H5410_035359 [Solanum commersonii]